MSKITVSIIRANIYAIAEGISISIAQHNGGTPTYEQLWASADESRKLDIYYREAISDLESRLTEWIKNTSAQFNLQNDGTDYTLELMMSPHWPSRLEGLLKNKTQDYLVHAVTAGWLNDFSGLEVKQDYMAMASQDLSDIRTIIYIRSFNFTESERATEPDSKHIPDDITPDARKEDTDTKQTPDELIPDARKEETDTKHTPDDVTPDARKEETDSKHVPDAVIPDARKEETDSKHTPDALTPDARKTDTDRFVPELKSPAGFRRKDDVVKVSNEDEPPYCKPKHLRHRDNDIVEHASDNTDWSGTGIVFRDKQSHHHRPACCCGTATPLEQAGIGIQQSSGRVSRGHGFTPSPIPPKPAPVPAGCAPVPAGFPAGHHPYPPIKSDGVKWSDMPLYDEAGSERAMVHHCPKPGCDGRDPDLKWDINDNK